MPLLGGFHHVAGTWDGTTVRIHVDGVEVAKTSYDSVSYIAAPTMLVGADSNTGVLGAYLTGDIDELCLYGRALSGSEIKALAAR
jgi:hypothetical protein